MENKYVSPEDLSFKLGSKENLYKILTIDCRQYFIIYTLVNLYLPPYEKCTTSFMKDILSKKKLVST